MLNYWWVLLICLVHGFEHFWSLHMLFCLEMFLQRVVRWFWRVFWSIFCLKMLLQRVVNVFGGFERFLKHAYVFLYWNVLWPDNAAYPLLYIHWISLWWFLTIQRWDTLFIYCHHPQLNTRTINELHLPETTVISCILVHVIYYNTYLPENVFSNHVLHHSYSTWGG